MRTSASRELALALGALMFGAPSLAQSACRAADSTSAALVAELTKYAGATSGDNKIVRDSLHIPLTSTSGVGLVTTAATCRKARDAYQAKFANTGGGAFSGRVYVIKLGSVYAVLDPGFKYSDPDVLTVQIVDSRFRHLANY